MTSLEKMLESEIPVSWKTILVGWDGPGKYPRQLSIADVASHALRLIERNPEQPPCVLQLAGARDSEIEMVDSCIRRLAAKENADIRIENRKWRLFLLRSVMERLGNDPLYWLLDLTEFWDKFDYPPDSPHIVQGRNNNLTPLDYYTEDNYRQTVEQHKQWIAKEQSLLRASSV